jgi:hypothetical protein
MPSGCCSGVSVLNDYVERFVVNQRILWAGDARDAISIEMGRNSVDSGTIYPRPGILGRYFDILTISAPNTDCCNDKHEVEKELQLECPFVIRHSTLVRSVIWVVLFFALVGFGSAIIDFPHHPGLWLCVLVLSVLLLFGATKIGDCQSQLGILYGTEGQRCH